MAIGGGLFGGRGKHPNLEHIAQALQNYLGLELITPSSVVLGVVDDMTLRELTQFDNLRSVEGMQELFRARSIRATVDQAARNVTLTIEAPEELEQELKTEHGQGQVLHVELSKPTAEIILPPEPEPLLAAPTSVEPTEPVPPEFEHLEGMEQLRDDLVDLFVKHGRLMSADKEVLRKINPAEGTLEGRVAALERWQGEISRRIRHLMVPKAVQPLTLGGDEEAQPDPVQALFRRYDTILHWMAKLIKAFEATGIRYHNKPMWLPH